MKMMNRSLMLACIAVILCGCDRPTPPGSPPVDNSPAPILPAPHPANAEPDRPVAASDGAPVLDEYIAEVTAVTDGDTISVLTADNQTIRLRLKGIDAPERGQPFGNNAKQFLSDLVFGESVRVVVLDTDHYGRSVAEVYAGEDRITLELVRAGLAWHYKYHSDDADLAAAEVSAQTNELGLWSDRRRVAPWDWRKLTDEERDKLR